MPRNHHCPSGHSNTAACKRNGCIKQCTNCSNYVNDRNSEVCRSCTTKEAMAEKRKKEAENKKKEAEVNQERNQENQRIIERNQ